MSFNTDDAKKLNLLYPKLKLKFDDYKNKNIKLDMSRGKPDSEQLDLSNEILNCLDRSEYISEEGIDCRNYGALDGLSETKKLFSQILSVPTENIIIGGNSSLNLMYDMISYFMTHGSTLHKPWCREEKVKFLCPSPGYDRHFSVTQFFNIEMIPIKINNDGPDMDTIEKLVSSDKSIKGIWCVPKYSNPTGIIYSDEVVRRFANLKPKAEDFRIFWDNAYAVHDLYDKQPILNIIEECEKASNPDMPIVFASFSKVTFGGASISCIASSLSNIYYFKRRFFVQIISHDKINQLRHCKMFKDLNSLDEHMKKHADILRPKFEFVQNKFKKEFEGLDICTWSNPKGGYFISFNSSEGCAKKIEQYCKQCGLVITPAGSTYPYMNDEKDSNIRIAPSFLSLEQLEIATDIFCTCVKLASYEKYIENKN